MKRLIRASYATEDIDLLIEPPETKYTYHVVGWYNDEGYAFDAQVKQEPISESDQCWYAKIDATGKISYYSPTELKKVAHFKKFDATYGTILNYLKAVALQSAKKLDRYRTMEDFVSTGCCTMEALRRMIHASVDTGLNYWYLTKHGLGPGTIPQGVTVIDHIDDMWDTYILLDRMLNTEELQTYDLKEVMPPEELLPESFEHQKRLERIDSSDDTDDWDDIDEEFEDIDDWDYSEDAVVPAIASTLNISEDVASIIYEWYDVEDAWDDFDSVEDFCSFLKRDIYDMIDGCSDDPYDNESDSNIVRDALGLDPKWAGSEDYIGSSTVTKVSEDIDSIQYVVASDEPNSEECDEADLQEIEGMSLTNYKGYRILVDPDTHGWAIIGRDRELIKGGFLTEREAKAYIDSALLASTSCEEDIAASSNWYEVPDHDLDPPEYPDPDEQTYTVPFSLVVDVRPNDTSWDVYSPAEIDTSELPSTGIRDLDTDRLKEDIEYNAVDAIDRLPETAEGHYLVTGLVTLEIDHYAEYIGPDWDDVEDSYYVQDTNIQYDNIVPVDEAAEIKGGMTKEELDDAILNDKPFDLSSFKKYKIQKDPEALLAQDVEVNDVIDLEFDASEVNLGTVVQVLSINDPSESWADFTFRCTVLDPSKGQSTKEGDEITLHFDTDDEVGYLVPM